MNSDLIKIRTKLAIKRLAPREFLTIWINRENLQDVWDYYAWKHRQKQPIVLREPIFLIGCPRSGTSLSARLFSLHPDVANWTEAQRVWDPVNFFDLEADHCWEASRVDAVDARRLHALFEYYRQKHHKARFMNKNPRNTVRIDYIQAIFPDAYFVHVIRDGRAVVNSILKKAEREPFRKNFPFWNFCKPPNWRQFVREDPVEQAALQWREIVSYVLARRDRLGTRYMEYRYEDLCRRPRQILKQVFQFVGLPVDDAILEAIPAVIESRNDKFRQDLTPEHIERITTLQKPVLEQLGYTL